MKTLKNLKEHAQCQRAFGALQIAKDLDNAVQELQGAGELLREAALSLQEASQFFPLWPGPHSEIHAERFKGLAARIEKFLVGGKKP